ncbi:hypothetical protein MRBL20_003314 [Peribacillus frigoritolerans]
MIQSNTFNSIGMVLSQFYTELIGAEGTRLLLRKARLGETPQEQAEEAPRPPAESECLEHKSTFESYKPKRRQMGVGKRNVPFIKRSSRIICPKTTPSTP